MSPERSAAPVLPLAAGLTGLRYLVWMASGRYLPGADVAGRLNIFANCFARS